MQKEFIKQDQREWKVLTFYLKNDFTFRAEYSYEIDEEAGRYEREMYWAYETLDIVPKDDFDKKILDEYLQHKKNNIRDRFTEVIPDMRHWSHLSF